MSAPDRADAPPGPSPAAASLRDELASLRIERKRPHRAPRAAASAAPTPRRAAEDLATVAAADALDDAPRRPAYAPRPPRRRGELGLRLLGLALWLIPLGLLGGGGYVAYLQYQKTRPKPTVALVTVNYETAGEAGSVLTAKGYLRAFQQAKIGAKMPGRVAEVRVVEGMKVAQGDVLAVLEHSDLKAQLESRLAMVERTRAELKEAEADLKFKDIKARRTRRLRAQGQTSIEEADQADSAYEMAVQRLASLGAAIKAQESQANEVRVAIQDMHIVAPFSGTVVEKAAEVGETIMLGGLGAASGRGSVVTLADLDNLEVETDIDEDLLARIALNQDAEVAVSSVPDRRYKGKYVRMVPLGDRARGTVKIYVRILDADARLFPELAATVYFLPRATPDPAEAAAVAGLYVPRSAVVEAGGRRHVWVVDATGTAHLRPVEVTFVESRARVASGLDRGDRVVADPPATLADGMAVATGS